MRRLAAASLALLVASVAGALAQTYPSQPVHVVVPFPPGGGTDASARIIAQALGDQMGQQVVVDSRGGASGRSSQYGTTSEGASHWVPPVQVFRQQGIRHPHWQRVLIEIND